MYTSVMSISGAENAANDLRLHADLAQEDARESTLVRNVLLCAFVTRELLVVSLELTIADMRHPLFAALSGITWLAGAAGAELSRRSTARLSREARELAVGFDVLSTYEDSAGWDKRIT